MVCLLARQCTRETNALAEPTNEMQPERPLIGRDAHVEFRLQYLQPNQRLLFGGIETKIG
jgi:hypothetical protein